MFRNLQSRKNLQDETFVDLAYYLDEEEDLSVIEGEWLNDEMRLWIDNKMEMNNMELRKKIDDLGRQQRTR